MKNKYTHEIISMRKRGYSYNYISKLLKIDRTTVRYHCIKYRIVLKGKEIHAPRNPKYKRRSNLAVRIPDPLIPVNVKESKIKAKDCDCGRKYLPTPKSPKRCLLCHYGK